ncbi:MAG: hemolysin family protein [Actinomycetia bacterium]|nr:hemolysin family protein [Actinomycetes bacterium]
MTSTDIWMLAAAAALIAVAGVLSAADAAINRVSRVSLDAYEREGRRGVESLRHVLGDPARYVNVALFLRALARISAVVLVAVVAVDVLDSRWEAVLVAVSVMVVVDYIVVGVAPRTLGRQHAARIALATAPVVYRLASVLAPLTKLLILIGNALTPGKGFRDGPFASEAELRDLVDLAEERSLIEDDERQMIHSVFELGETLAREVMVPRTDMVFVERHKTLRQALSLGLRSGFSRIPVIGDNEDDVVGIVYLKDVAKRAFDHRDAESTEKVESVMRSPFFVPDSRAADELLKDMQASRTHIAVVLDEYGGVAGLVTIEDILEEIVGEIADEYDVEGPPAIEHLPDGSMRVSARLHVDDLAEALDLDVDAEDFEDVDTVGGMLAKFLGKVPIPGATVEAAGLKLCAESATGRRNQVGTVLVSRLSEPASTDAEESGDE